MLNSEVAGSIFLILFTYVKCADWTYEGSTGPDQWCALDSGCCGANQSPIDLTFNVKPKIGLSLKFIQYNVRPQSMIMENNGHSVSVRINSPEVQPRISRGGLKGTYIFHSFHFHWGSDSSKGSEHTILKKKFPIELHLVHFSSRYGSLTEALASGKSDALAVLGILYEVSAIDNPNLRPITDNLRSVRYNGQSQALEPFPLGSLLPSLTSLYFRYPGSLTTPSCSEAVVWTVFPKTVPISETQLRNFRRLYFSAENEIPDPMVDNYRPVLPLNNRSVKLTFGLFHF